MNTPCPHCQIQIEIDPETLAALQGNALFQCPSCGVEVPVPNVARAPLKVTAAAAIRHNPAATTSTPKNQTGKRNLFILGASALLFLIGLGFFLSSSKSGEEKKETKTEVTYPSVVMADKPISYYRFEETSGTTAADSANGNNGTYRNGIALNQSGLPALGKAVRLDGIDDHVATPNLANGDFTLEAWINTTSNSHTGGQGYVGTALLWSDVPGYTNDFVMSVLNNRLAFFTGNPDTTVIGTTEINDGKWHHLVVTRSKGGKMEVYVDGEFQGSMPTNNQDLSANQEVLIGGDKVLMRHFKGLIDEVAYYPHVLSLERIRAHHKAGMEVVSSQNP